jgi:hypothetical protein
MGHQQTAGLRSAGAALGPQAGNFKLRHGPRFLSRSGRRTPSCDPKTAAEFGESAMAVELGGWPIQLCGAAGLDEIA